MDLLVIAGISRRDLSWVGAVVMSSISTFKNLSISRAMYQEYGKSIVKEMKLWRRYELLNLNAFCITCIYFFCLYVCF